MRDIHGAIMVPYNGLGCALCTPYTMAFEPRDFEKQEKVIYVISNSDFDLIALKQKIPKFQKSN